MTLDQIIKGANERINNIYAHVRKAPKASEVNDKFPVGVQEMLQVDCNKDRLKGATNSSGVRVLHLRPFFPSSYYNEQGENYVWADDVACRAMTRLSLEKGAQIGKQIIIGELDDPRFSAYYDNGIAQYPIEKLGSQWVWDKIRCFSSGMAAYRDSQEYSSILFTDIDSVVCRGVEKYESSGYVFQDFIVEGANPQEAYGTPLKHDHLFAAYCEMWQSMAPVVETYLRHKRATIDNSPILQALSELSHSDPVIFFTFAYYNIPNSEFLATSEFWNEMVDFRNTFPDLEVVNAFFVEQFFGSLFVKYRGRLNGVGRTSFGPYYYWMPRQWDHISPHFDTDRFVHMIGASKTDATWNHVLSLWLERYYPEMFKKE